MTLRDAWDANAERWIQWARSPGHDSYWHFHGRRFFELVPPPGRLTIDLGCGEGRVSRDLVARGHRVVAIDGSFTMAHACATGSSSQTAPMVTVGDAARVPLRNRVADLVVAFMSLQDVNDLAGAVEGAARVLEPCGRLCLAIVHPINSAGEFGDLEAESRFFISGSYMKPSFYEDDIAHDGMRMVFTSAHRPLQTYAEALFEAGFAIERLREVTEPDQDVPLERRKRWQRIPLFLHLRAVKLPQSSSS